MVTIKNTGSSRDSQMWSSCCNKEISESVTVWSLRDQRLMNPCCVWTSCPTVLMKEGKARREFSGCRFVARILRSFARLKWSLTVWAGRPYCAKMLCMVSITQQLLFSWSQSLQAIWNGHQPWGGSALTDKWWNLCLDISMEQLARTHGNSGEAWGALWVF